MLSTYGESEISKSDIFDGPRMSGLGRQYEEDRQVYRGWLGRGTMLTDEMKERSSANMSSTSHLTPIRWVHHENEGSSFSSPILRLKDISGSPSPGKRFNRRREPNYEGERSI